MIARSTTVLLRRIVGTRPVVGSGRRLFSQESHDDFKPSRKSLTDQDVDEIIRKDISSNKVFLYMKGTPQSPMCGFSRQVVMILNNEGVNFKSRNVLDDPAVREGIKKFSDWPTIPQLY